MNILHAIILGLVEGITEFLPISSTAHLDLTRQFLNLPSNDFIKSFEIIIQLGAILAVIVLYWRKIFSNFQNYFRLLSIAFLPAAIIGLLAYQFIKDVLIGNNLVMALSLLIGGIIIYIIELLNKAPKLENISNQSAFKIGLFQCLAMIPGVSRAGATIMGGLTLGIKRETIVEFSFLLAIPTMLAATGLDLIKSDFSFSSNEWTLLAVGLVTAFASAIIVIKLFLAYIAKHNFIYFALYRIALGLTLLIFILNS
jgi:undecaprenyl-diphosphatase